MGGKSSSSTSSKQQDQRTVGTDNAIVAGPGGRVEIIGTDPGILAFGSDVVNKSFEIAQISLGQAFKQSETNSEQSNETILSALSSLDKQPGDDFSDLIIKFGLPAILLAGVAYGALKK